ncbi:hypothetical protein KP509_33G016300 [Ceratopteris richardii]|uniref:Alpha/beta hydrolase fold-3 domain-containing protein n=1 Tax=Ceratopteris richardii TaxID=49495 RepID=A0A8T2QLZ0_CERRI|nr:hypothetical protein KP509_33G016300 [Ceratopteris richardii]
MATIGNAEDTASPADYKGVVPLTTWVLISNFKVSYNLLRRPDGTFNRNLAEFLDRKVPANAVPSDGVASMDVMIDRAIGLWGRLFWACETLADPAVRLRRQPLLTYFHGGSFVHSSANSSIYDAMCRRLARMCGVVVLSVNFRRAPEHRFPIAYEDCAACVRWAKGAVGRQCLAEVGGDPDRCFVAGDSSGGNIAHAVAVILAAEGVRLSGMVLLMPMFGGQQRTPAERLLDGKYFVSIKDRDWYWRAFLPPGATRDHPACDPFSPIAPSLVHLPLPPCLAVVGGYDILQDWQLRYVHSLQRAGKSVQLLFLEQATMGFFLLPNSDLFYTLVDRLKEFFGNP